MALAAALNLVAVSRDSAECDLLLVVSSTGLELRESGPRAAGGVRIDFGHTDDMARRLATASRRQPLARAVGLKKRTPTVVDATAGLGRDAMLLARLGCTVTAIERSNVLAEMWRDALERAPTGFADDKGGGDRLTLIVGDSAEILRRMAAEEAPDVVYLDPMYPPKAKSALPKKEMRILRRLVGDDLDVASLFDVAREVASDRVVVKRPPYAPPLATSPTTTCSGKLARYDIYLALDRRHLHTVAPIR